MSVPALAHCRDALSALTGAMEAAARALGERLAASMDAATVTTALLPLQVTDLTAQRCAHCRDALALLAGFADPALVAPGCRLQARQLGAAAADFTTAATALLSATGGDANAARLEALAGRLTSLVTRLEDLAGPCAEEPPGLRADLIARLAPAYTMDSERAILARFLSGDPAPPAPAPPAASDPAEDFFL